jgi:hypothetical protein
MRDGALSAPLLHMGGCDDLDFTLGGMALMSTTGGGLRMSSHGAVKTRLPMLGNAGKSAGRAIGLARGRGGVRAWKGGGGVEAWMGDETGGGRGGGGADVIRRKSKNASPYVVEARRVQGGGGGHGANFKAEMGTGRMAVVRRLAREHVHGAPVTEMPVTGVGGLPVSGVHLSSISSTSVFDDLRAVSR